MIQERKYTYDIDTLNTLYDTVHTNACDVIWHVLGLGVLFVDIMTFDQSMYLAIISDDKHITL